MKTLQLIKKHNCINGIFAFGEGFQARIPRQNLRVFEVFEDFLSVRETGIERADEGDSSEREGSERSVGFDEVGMELFEL